MGSEERSSAMSQKISSLSRSNSSSSSKHDSRQVTHTSWRHCRTRRTSLTNVWLLYHELFTGKIGLCDHITLTDRFVRGTVLHLKLSVLRDVSVSWEEIDLTVNALTTWNLANRSCSFLRWSSEAPFASFTNAIIWAPVNVLYFLGLNAANMRKTLESVHHCLSVALYYWNAVWEQLP